MARQKKPTVAIILPHLQPRGAQIVAWTLHEMLKKQFNFTVFTGWNPGYSIPLEANYNLPENFDDFDVIHLHYCGNDLDLPDGLGKKLLVTNHQVTPIYGSQCAQSISVYDNGSDWIPNPLPWFPPNIKAAAAIIEPKSYILTVSTTHYAKGRNEYTDILRKLLLNYGPYSPCEFVFLGSGPDMREFSELLLSFKHQGLKTHFIPFLEPEIASGLIHNAKALLHPSLSEAASITLLQAQAFEVPVYALNVGGNPQTVGYGCLTDKEGLGRLFEWKIDWDKIKENAEFIRTRHNPQTVANEYSIRYLQVAGQ